MFKKREIENGEEREMHIIFLHFPSSCAFIYFAILLDSISCFIPHHTPTETTSVNPTIVRNDSTQFPSSPKRVNCHVCWTTHVSSLLVQDSTSSKSPSRFSATTALKWREWPDWTGPTNETRWPWNFLTSWCDARSWDGNDTQGHGKNLSLSLFV